MNRIVAGLGLALLALVLPVAAQDAPTMLLLRTDFEAGAPNWSLTGLWDVDGTPASMPGGAASSGSQSLNYNDGTDYDTGNGLGSGINSGTATSPEFVISPFARQTVTFRCNYRTQTTGTSYDKRIVRVRRDNGIVFETTLRGWGTNPPAGRCSAMGVWHSHTIEIPAIANPGDIVIMITRSMQLEFVFDTVNAQSNNYPGWFVDDVLVSQSTVTPPLPTDDHGNTKETATFLAGSQPVDGQIEQGGDVDFFKFQAGWIVRPPMPGAPPPRPRTFEVRTLGLSGGMDSVIHLYDQNGTELASDDDGGGGYASKITWTTGLGNWFFVKVRHFSDSGTGGYKIKLSWPQAPAEDDHGNTPQTATLIQPNDPATAGVIETAGDVDFFETPQIFFIMDPGPRTYIFETSELSDGMDSVIELYASDGTTLLAENDDAPGLGLASRVTWVATAGTRFYIKVRHYSSTGTGSYKIRAMEVNRNP